MLLDTTLEKNPRVQAARLCDYEITLNVPGLSSDDVSIEIQGDRLVVRGQKEERHHPKDKHYYRVERSVGTFQRTLSLHKQIKKIKALRL